MFAVYVVKQHTLKMKENYWKGTALFLKLSRIPCSVYVRVQVQLQVLSSALDIVHWSGLCTGHFVLDEEHIVYSPVTLVWHCGQAVG
jgi:hypothetical protein